MHVRIGPWDVLLVVVVSIQATVLAYLPQPRWKAFVLSLPIPFTVATLAVGRPVGATNVLGLLLLFLYAQGVRVLNQRLRVPIVPAIALSALGYCALGALLAPVLPNTDDAFWLVSVGMYALAVGLVLKLPDRSEPSYRSLLPVWLKLPVIMGVILFLVVIKGFLQGFTTVFPMVGVVATYEGRHSLWTIGRQIPTLMVAMIPMMATCRLAQAQMGLGPALMVSWVVFLSILVPLTRFMWSRARTESSGLVAGQP